jgi:hippurate hydrolase
MNRIDDDRLASYLPELIALRRDLHAHPETALEEVRTAGIVADHLREWGIEVHEKVGVTGVVGVLHGRRSGRRAIGLRADMDALHMEEHNHFAYRSTVPGKMHACGHDGHTAMLLGAARYLAADPDFAGTVNFLFQPAEEGTAGAKAMIADGLFDRFPIDLVFGLHTDPARPLGEFATRTGPALAGALTFRAEFRGSGGHGGAGPHHATDVTIPAAQFILALQTIIGRNISSLDSAVISVGHVAAGSFASPNVMPSEFMVAGTARYFRKDVLRILKDRMIEQAELLARASRCSAEVTIEEGTPPLVNSPDGCAVALRAAVDTVGEDHVDSNRTLSTGAEDFAYFVAERPGAYCWMGAGPGPDGVVHDVHTHCFDFNDATLADGVRYWVNLVRHTLGD